jgi:enoyl-CoA hydratase
MEEHITTERHGPVEWITLNRPERLNAITSSMAHAFADHLAVIREDESARVVVLQGAGSGFCAGLDIVERQRDVDQSGIARLPEVVSAMYTLPQPIVALINGPACGGGLAFALAADIRIATPSARFNDAFVTLGLSGCELGMSWFLPRMVGLSVANELMLTGRFVDGERAHLIGLVSELVGEDDLHRAGQRMADDICRNAPYGVRQTKATLRAALDVDDLRAVIDMEQKVQLECMKSGDFEEALKAFVEKRPPNFS